MRPELKNRIAVFSLQGFIDANNAPYFIELEDMKYTSTLDIDMVMISLEKVIFFNAKGLEVLASLLKSFHDKMKVVVGFCDYDQKKYDAIVKFKKTGSVFYLFRTLEIAHLFNDAATEGNNTKILVWHEDSNHRSALAIALFEHGHNPVVAQNEAEFKKLKDDEFDYVVNNTELGSEVQSVAGKVVGNAVIYTIKGYLDAEIKEAFDLAYHINSLNIDFKIFIFDAVQISSMNVHAQDFFIKLATHAKDYGATICIVGLDFSKTPPSLKIKMEEAGILFFDLMDEILKNQELLKKLGGNATTKKKNQRTITKVLVNNLQNFIEATVRTFEMMTEETAVKKAAAVQVLSIDTDQKLFASSLGFYGDLDGVIMLIFPVGVAHKASALLLGEDNPTDEDILDTIAEFVNIIGGRVKAILGDNGAAVNITLPKTYTDINELLEISADKKGVQVDLALGDQHFTFFLTR